MTKVLICTEILKKKKDNERDREDDGEDSKPAPRPPIREILDALNVLSRDIQYVPRNFNYISIQNY